MRSVRPGEMVWSEEDESLADCVYHSLDPALGVELAQDRIYVELDRVLADVQEMGDSLVFATPLPRVAGHLAP